MKNKLKTLLVLLLIAVITLSIVACTTEGGSTDSSSDDNISTNEETKKKVVEQYDSLVLYRHFLIPMETYEQRYPEEENPAIYEAYRDGKAKKLYHSILLDVISNILLCYHHSNNKLKLKQL